MKKMISALALGTALSGCVTGQPLREMAMDSNRLVARTADEQTMLNILRAKDRMPMHFTSFSGLQGSITMKAEASLGGTFPTDAITTNDLADPSTGISQVTESAVDTLTPKIGGSLTANPSFDLVVYDTQKFQNGILQPIKGSVIELFLQQGWPEDFLSAVFIDKMEITIDEVDAEGASNPNQKTKENGFRHTAIWRNHASDDLIEVVTGKPNGGRVDPDKRFRTIGGFPFSDLIAGTRMVSLPGGTSYVPVIDMAEVNEKIGFEDITKLEASGLRIKKATDLSGASPDDKRQYIARAKTSEKSINLLVTDERLVEKVIKQVVGSNFNLSEACFSSRKFGSTTTIQVGFPRKIENAPKPASLVERKCDNSDPDKNSSKFFYSVSYTISPRSPKGVMHFLGEYVRYDLDDEKCVYTIGNAASTASAKMRFCSKDGGLKPSSGEKIITVSEASTSDAALSVFYRGKTYSMPISTNKNSSGDVTHRGPQALVLVQQIVNLQKEADSLPVSSTIRLIPN